MQSAARALGHFDGRLEVVENYGDMCGSVMLHTWDDGKRVLLRCRECGGYVLVQMSEYHGEVDAYYTDYFPVSGPEEAAELNRTLNGWKIEDGFGRRYLIQDNDDAPRWSR